MKKILHFFIIVLAISLLQTEYLCANPVDTTTAKAIAAQFFNRVSPTLTRGDEITMAYAATSPRTDAVRGDVRETPCLYVFNVGSNGFIIVSASDCAHPVLGYSTEGAFDADNVPEGLRDILDNYKNEIAAAITGNIAAPEHIMAEWSELRNPSRGQSRTAVIINPLIRTTWNQEPYYNDLCPVYDGCTSGHVVTGCVATATAQLIRYWEWPVRGTGSHGYDAYLAEDNSIFLGHVSADFGNTVYLYNLMPLSVTVGTPSAYINEVAKLSYHCGVASNMRYGCDGSGANLGSAYTALLNYFDYSGDQYTAKANYTDDQWEAMLRNDLDRNYPVLYSGNRENGAGHAYICDGYNDQHQFHFNFGWGGNSNGYFAVSGGTGLNEYSYNVAAAFGVHPNRPECNNCFITVDLSNVARQNGWDGAYIVIKRNGKALKALTLRPDQSSASYSFEICEGGLTFEWGNGNNDANCDFAIRNADNDVIFNGNGASVSGDFFTVNYACSDCPYPTELAAQQIAETSADVVWSCAGAPTDFNIEYGPSGFERGTGTTVNHVSAPFSIEGLEGETDYDFYVQANCSNGDQSGWSSAYAFQTIIFCSDENHRVGAIAHDGHVTSTIPVSSYFSDLTHSYTQQIFTASDLQSVGVVGGRINSISIETASMPSPTALTDVHVYLGNTLNANLSSGFVSNSALTEVYAGDWTLANSATSAWHTLEFQTPFIYDGESNIVIAILCNGADALNDVANHFRSRSCETAMAIFCQSASAIDPLNPSGEARLTNSQNSIRFDVCMAKGCYTPIDVVASAVTEHTAEISWNCYGNDFNVEYGPHGFVPGTGTTLYNVQNPCTLQNLLSNTSYDVYVQSACDAGSTSDWSDVLEIRTIIYCFGNNHVTCNSTQGNYQIKVAPIDFNSADKPCSYSQQLFTQSELASMGLYDGRINSVAFYGNSSLSGTLHDVSVYIGHTSSENLSGGWAPFESLTRVYSGDWTITPNSWSTIAFPTPFMYDGSSNLIIAVLCDDASALNGSNGAFRAHQSSGICLRAYQSADRINPSQLVSSSYAQYRSNIRFDACLDTHCESTSAQLEQTVCRTALPLEWNGVTFTEAGHAEVVLINSTGCDSIVTMSLTVEDPDTLRYNNLVGCQSFTFSGRTYRETGTYTVQMPAYGNTCPTIYLLDVTIYTPDTTHIHETVCESYTWNNTTYTTSGTYYKSVPNGVCPEVTALHLTVNHGSFRATSVTALGSYTWTDGDGELHLTSGTYIYEYENENECPCADTLHLTIHESVATEDFVTLCDSDLPYTYNDTTFEDGTPSLSTFHFHLSTQAGCDSTVTLHLTINESATSEDFITICDNDLPYTYNDTTFETGTPSLSTFIFHLSTQDGCDSTVTLHLTIHESAATEEAVTIRERDLPYTYNDTVFETGTPSLSTFHFHLSTQNGCDSIVTLQLTVVSIDNEVWEYLTPEDGASGLHAAQNNAEYQWFDCNTNAPVEGATEQDFWPEVAGSYFVVISYQGVTDTSDCYEVTDIIGISENSEILNISVYPNPTKGSIKLSTNNHPSSINGEIRIYDVNGKYLFTKKIDGEDCEIDLSGCTPGTYYLHVTDGKTMLKAVKVVKW